MPEFHFTLFSHFHLPNTSFFLASLVFEDNALKKLYCFGDLCFCSVRVFLLQILGDKHQDSVLQMNKLEWIDIECFHWGHKRKVGRFSSVWIPITCSFHWSSIWRLEYYTKFPFAEELQEHPYHKSINMSIAWNFFYFVSWRKEIEIWLKRSGPFPVKPFIIKYPEQITLIYGTCFSALCNYRIYYSKIKLLMIKLNNEYKSTQWEVK